MFPERPSGHCRGRGQRPHPGGRTFQCYTSVTNLRDSIKPELVTSCICGDTNTIESLGITSHFIISFGVGIRYNNLVWLTMSYGELKTALASCNGNMTTTAKNTSSTEFSTKLIAQQYAWYHF